MKKKMAAFEYYLVLPSNSSMKYFPENKTCFTTQLPKEFNLIGEWYVGISEIHIPCTISHIRNQSMEQSLIFGLNSNSQEREEEEEDEGSTSMSYADVNSWKAVGLPFGIYTNIDEFIRTLNNTSSLMRGHQIFEKDPNAQGYVRTRRCCTLEICKKIHCISFHEKTARILSFQNALNRFERKEPEQSTGALLVFDISVNTGSVTADLPTSLSRVIPDQLFVYSDICEPYTVGDTRASLLRIVSMNTTNFEFGSTIVKHFAPVKYLRLMRNCFQTIVIDIRDAFGVPVAFEYGTLTVTLHFKRIF